MGQTLYGKAPSNTYKDLLHLGNSNQGLTSNVATVCDGKGTDSKLQLSTSQVRVSGDSEVFVVVDGSNNSIVAVNTTSKRLSISGNLDIPNTTHDNQFGVITKNGVRFIHDFNYGSIDDRETEGHNVFIGENAGNFTMGNGFEETYHASHNVGIGAYVLYYNTSGFKNVAVGALSLRDNTEGYENVTIGYGSLVSNDRGSDNVAIGLNSLSFNTNGSDNVAVGSYSLYSNTLGTYNVALGEDSLAGNTTGNYNIALGYCAGQYIFNGSTSLKNPNNSIFIGNLSKALADNGTNEIVIGYDAIGAGSNSVVLGNGNISKTILRGNVAFGVSDNNPTAKVDIQGSTGYNQLRLRTSYTPTSTNDTNGNTGNITWDNNYIYVKTSSGWKRSQLSTF